MNDPTIGDTDSDGSVTGQYKPTDISVGLGTTVNPLTSNELMYLEIFTYYMYLNMEPD